MDTSTQHTNTSHTKPKVLVLVGPTASGKTAVSLRLADLLHGEIVSADSRQVYEYLDIGTAKPLPEELKRVKHYFISELTPERDFNAGEFGLRGRKVIKDVFRRNKTPIVVGGSGLYVRSLIDGLFEGPGADKEFREALEARVESGEIELLIEELRRVDPVAAQRADPTKPRRIIRALEVYHTTGKPISQHHREDRLAIDFKPIMFGLSWARKRLYARIEQRCDEMIADGLLKEVEALERMGYGRWVNALNTVGYKEAFAYRAAEISYHEMVRLFKQNSRRYAKRQLTWFRKDARIRWVIADDLIPPTSLANEIANMFLAAS